MSTFVTGPQGQQYEKVEMDNLSFEGMRAQRDALYLALKRRIAGVPADPIRVGNILWHPDRLLLGAIEELPDEHGKTNTTKHKF